MGKADIRRVWCWSLGSDKVSQPKKLPGKRLFGQGEILVACQGGY